ncbi:MAG: 6-phosphofructokinase [Anaerolineae bacterium]|nr:6-phosphofructokinase [Anaerolineae bacterium]
MRIITVVSGGDAPGINAALYHLALQAVRHGDTLLGALGGFPGLLNERIETLEQGALLPWIGLAGTYLQSSREPVLAQPAGRAQLAEVLARHQVDALVVFGGNGTLRHIPPLLAELGLVSIGLPTTIDNDVPGTEATLGFFSACDFAHRTIDGIRATGHALQGRIFTMETLGGDTGYLALEVAHSAGADVALIPEMSYDAAHVAARLKAGIEQRGQALMVYSEGLPGKQALLDALPVLAGIRIRDTRLGHAQRGSTPSHYDRWLAAQMARHALTSLHEGRRSGVICVEGGRIVVRDSLIGMPPRQPDLHLYNWINALPQGDT